MSAAPAPSTLRLSAGGIWLAGRRAGVKLLRLAIAPTAVGASPVLVKKAVSGGKNKVPPGRVQHPLGAFRFDKTLLAFELAAIFKRLFTSFGDQMHAVLSNAAKAACG